VIVCPRFVGVDVRPARPARAAARERLQLDVAVPREVRAACSRLMWAAAHTGAYSATILQIHAVVRMQAGPTRANLSQGAGSEQPVLYGDRPNGE